MSTPGPAESRASILWEMLLLWFVVNLLIRGTKFLWEGLGVHEAVLVLVPILFMYAPVVSCRFRGEDSNIYPISLPGLSGKDRRIWWDAIRYNGVLICITTAPFLLLYHLWHTRVLGHAFTGALPEQLWMIIGYHICFVGIPEEFFYRGYMQTRLDRVWEPRWNLFGAMVGPSLIVTSLFFAFGHSIVEFQWWHFAIFVPSLAFGWLRAKSKDVMAGAFFHAWCNIMVTVLDSLYGVTGP